jgi:hypothetical protein
MNDKGGGLSAKKEMNLGGSKNKLSLIVYLACVCYVPFSYGFSDFRTVNKENQMHRQCYMNASQLALNW